MMQTAATADEFFAYWNDLLDGKKPRFYDGKPQGGVYAMRRGTRNAQRIPVRIDKIDPETGELDYVNGKVTIWVNNEPAFESEYNNLWMSCGRNAVAWDAYEHRIAHGHWPDEAPPIAAPAADGVVTSTNNAPPPEEVHELLPYEIARATEWLKTFAVKTDADVLDATNRAAVLKALIGKAKKLHKAEKDEFLKAGQVIDRKYLDPMKEAEKVLIEIGKPVGAYHDKINAARREEEAKAAAARDAEMRAKLAAVAKEAPEKQLEAIKQVAQEIAAAPVTVEKAVTNLKSATGARGLTVRTKVIAHVVDQDALYAAVRARPEIVAALARIAQSDLDSGTLLPGVEKTETTVAK